MISFGPVKSRRLGKSLGINNIISPKVCSYGCVYCQAGETAKKSINRETFFKPENILNKVEQHIQKLDKDNYPDYLTFVSNGEPTLDENLGKTIVLLKKLDIPVAVITNSSLLHDKKVRDDLNLADWVSVKIDAGDTETWHKINRPSPDLNFEITIDNLILFASGFTGILCTETMLVNGINDSVNNFTAVAGIIKKINPLISYLSIPIRPPALSSVKPPETEKLNIAWQIFNDSQIKTELLTGFEGTDNGFTGNIYDDILNITSVHPLREDSMMELLQNDKADFQVVKSLIQQRLIRTAIYNGKKFYLREYHHQI
ncbi:MAG: radical SAM protein [Bacteroidetes bacterium]|nr:radical SAM protein [Bacteroidota bacterium]